MNRTAATIATALHGTSDPDLAVTVLTRAGATAAYTTPSGRYVGFTNATGATVAYLAPSGRYITVTTRAADQCRDLTGETGSTTVDGGTGWDVYLGAKQAVGARVSDHTVTGAVCPTCYIATPVITGVCETCAD